MITKDTLIGFLVGVVVVLITLLIYTQISNSPSEENTSSETETQSTNSQNVDDDELLDLPAYEEPFNPPKENDFNAALRYYTQIITNNENQYSSKKLNGFIAALKNMPQNNEVIDLLKKYEKHQATYYKYGLEKATHKFEKYQVKTKSDGKPESGYDVATRYGISVNRLCHFNPNNIIVIHKDVKGTIVTTTWKKDENGNLPLIDIYYKPQN